MRREALRLGRRQRRWFYAAFAVLFVSGAWWLALQSRLADSDAPPHPMQPWLVKVHGAAAMVALVTLGTLLSSHIRRGWVARRNRRSGALMVGTVGLLVLSGYGLYYAGDERLRALTAWAHDIVGLGLPGIIVLHIWRGRRTRRGHAATARTGEGA